MCLKAWVILLYIMCYYWAVVTRSVYCWTVRTVLLAGLTPDYSQSIICTVDCCKTCDTDNNRQAVARIADRTASQQRFSHVTASVMRQFDTYICHFLLVGLWPLSLTVSEIFNVDCNAMVDMTLIWPLNKGQSHSFWYQSISHIRLPIGSQ